MHRCPFPPTRRRLYAISPHCAARTALRPKVCWENERRRAKPGLQAGSDLHSLVPLTAVEGYRGGTIARLVRRRGAPGCYSPQRRRVRASLLRNAAEQMLSLSTAVPAFLSRSRGRPVLASTSCDCRTSWCFAGNGTCWFGVKEDWNLE